MLFFNSTRKVCCLRLCLFVHDMHHLVQQNAILFLNQFLPLLLLLCAFQVYYVGERWDIFASGVLI